MVVPPRQLNLITGPNGSGKSSLYRSLHLLAECAQGAVAQSLASEGGLPSTLWAGPEIIGEAVRRYEHAVEGTRRKDVVHLRLGFASDEFGYAIDLGLPPPTSSAFQLDPAVKLEVLWQGPKYRPAAALVERRGNVCRVRGDDGEWTVIEKNIAKFDSMMARLGDPRSAPELLTVRDAVRAWRFYDHFRADAASPARTPQIGTHTPVLANDGHDLAAAIQTIREIGEEEALAAAVDDAFPGSQVEVETLAGRFALKMRQHGLLRPLNASELSDGTLRYLLWIAALLTPRPPSLMVLNEPETSLHPDLLPALARLIARAAAQSQLNRGVALFAPDRLARSETRVPHDRTREELRRDGACEPGRRAGLALAQPV